jgi:hypothetical protein
LLKSSPNRYDPEPRFGKSLRERAPVPQQNSTTNRPEPDSLAQASRHRSSNPKVKTLLAKSYVSATLVNMGLSCIPHISVLLGAVSSFLAIPIQTDSMI